MCLCVEGESCFVQYVFVAVSIIIHTCKSKLITSTEIIIISLNYVPIYILSGRQIVMVILMYTIVILYSAVHIKVLVSLL